jgi:hypothetical protein
VLGTSPGCIFFEDVDELLPPELPPIVASPAHHRVVDLMNYFSRPKDLSAIDIRCIPGADQTNELLLRSVGRDATGWHQILRKTPSLFASASSELSLELLMIGLPQNRCWRSLRPGDTMNIQ